MPVTVMSPVPVQHRGTLVGMSNRWQKGLDAVKRLPASEQRSDSEWFSSYTGLGVVGKDKRLGGGFELTPISDLEATDMWRGDDLCARAIETLPDEMLRQGFEIRIAEPKESPERLPGEPAEPGADDETYAEAAARGDGQGYITRRRARRDADAKHAKLAEEITAKLEDLNFNEVVRTVACYERAFGGGAIMLGVKDGGDLSKPLRPDAVRSLDWLMPLEPRECQPIAWYDDPRAPKFGQPALFQINPTSDGVSTSQPLTVHESRLIIFGGVRVSRRAASGVVSGWGDSVLTRVFRVLRDYNMSWSAAAILLQEYSQTVIGVTDLHEIMASGNAKALRNRFQQIQLGRSIAHAVLIDAEKETHELKTTTLTGLDSMLDKMAARVAAALDMPLTRLMGTSPGGLNATGESDTRGWYDRVRAHQDRKLRPVIERVVTMLFKVLGAAEPDSWSVHFHPLWQPTDQERAATMFLMAQVDEKNIASQMYSPEEAVKNRFGTDGAMSLDVCIDWDARAAGEVAVPPPAKTEAQLEQEQHERDMSIKTLEAKTAPPPPAKK